jgi:putative addiction module component (TIGR02574 family)
MSTDVAEIETKIRSLSSEDKMELLRSLIAELDGPDDTEVEQAWLKEARRRHREIEEGKNATIPAERVFANLHASM